MWTIRPARLDDAAAIAAVHVASWQVAYRGQLPDAVLDALTPDQRAPGWERTIAMPDHDTLVGEVDDRIVGFTLTGAGRDDDANGCGELTAIYLYPDFWLRRLGAALHDAALDALRARGFTAATLWTLDTHTRVRALYERSGWVADGSAKDDTVGRVDVHEVRYVRNLD